MKSKFTKSYFLKFFQNHKVLIALLIIGSILRILFLDKQSLWIDEIHSLNESNPDFSFSQLYDALLASDPHPPLYFLLVQLFFKIFGYSTFVLRLVSAIFGILGLVVIYKLGKEFVNKKVGLIAVALLTINYFHLYYSQEARMYSMLFFTTSLSFLYLLKFIKKPNVNSAILHGFFASLMIYTHFFALFGLMAQYLVLLTLLFTIHKNKILNNLKYIIISGMITLVLYIPCFKILLSTANKTSFWIPVPPNNVYSEIFKNFFGNSEIVILFVFVFFFSFLFKIFNKQSSDYKIEKDKDYININVLVLFTWIFVVLIIPLILSYINLPMIIDRYFINILPAIIIIISIGVYYIKNKVASSLILILFLVFSMVDVLIVKNYYNQVTKSQIREVSEFLTDRHNESDDIVTELSWYFPFYLKNKVLINDSMEKYLLDVQKGIRKIKPFWHLNAHIKSNMSSNEIISYLNEYYFLEDNIQLFDSYAIRYVPKSRYNILEFNLDQYKLNATHKIQYNIEKFELNNNKIIISGWAFLDNLNSKNSEVIILAVNKEKSFKIPIKHILREDVTLYFKSKKDLNFSGFDNDISLEYLSKGSYQIGILIINKSLNKIGIQLTDQYFEIQ